METFLFVWLQNIKVKSQSRMVNTSDVLVKQSYRRRTALEELSHKTYLRILPTMPIEIETRLPKVNE